MASNSQEVGKLTMLVLLSIWSVVSSGGAMRWFTFPS